MSDPIRTTLRAMRKQGISFAVSMPSGGMTDLTDTAVEFIIRYGLEEFQATTEDVSVEELRAYQNEAGWITCVSCNKNGKRCRNTRPLQARSPKEFRSLQSWRCHCHAKELVE